MSIIILPFAFEFISSIVKLKVLLTMIEIQIKCPLTMASIINQVDQFKSNLGSNYKHSFEKY